MFSIFICLTVLTISDTTYHVDNPVELDPIIVTAKRDASRLSKIVNSGISIPSHQIDQSSDNNILDHLSNNYSSISLTSSSMTGFGLGPRGQGKISIRGLGFSPNRGVLVLIDGRPDIAGLFGHPLPDTYRSTGIFSAELIKGASSTLYGSNAIAGVLELTSFYRPQNERYSNIELSRGSFDTFNGSIRHSQKRGNFILAGWYDHLESDNQRKNNTYSNNSTGFKIHFDNSNNMQVFLSGKYSDFKFDDPGPVYNPTILNGEIMRSGLTLGIDKTHQDYLWSFRIYNSYGTHEFSDGFESIDRHNGIDLFGKLKNTGIENLQISGGISFNRLGGSASDGTPFVKSGNFHENEFAAHLQTEIDLSEIVEFTLGGRMINHDQYNNHFVYQAGLVVSPDKIGSIKLSTASSYRNPTINESQLFVISNSEDLNPEEGVSYELGYFNQIGRVFSVETALFYRTGNNLIMTQPNPNAPPAVKFVNSGDYSHTGWEMTLNYLINNFRIRPSFTHLNMTEFINSSPDDKLNVSISYDMDKINLNLTGIAAFNNHTDSLGTAVILDDYSLVNISASYKINNSFQINTSIGNLFDEKYEIIYGYPMPGRTFQSLISVVLY